jgi:hypothetical protein
MADKDSGLVRLLLLVIYLMIYLPLILSASPTCHLFGGSEIQQVILPSAQMQTRKNPKYECRPLPQYCTLAGHYTNPEVA